MNAPLDLALRPADQDVKRVVQKLADDFGARAMTARATREQHGHGEGLADAGVPDVVVFPHSNEEVASIVRLCHGARVPVIAFGVGTSLEGHVAAIYGGVCLDLSQMNRVLEVNAEDLDCRVQAGVTRAALNRVVARDGLFFPIDPGADGVSAHGRQPSSKPKVHRWPANSHHLHLGTPAHACARHPRPGDQASLVAVGRRPRVTRV